MIRNLVQFIVILGLICLLMGGGVAILYAVFKADLRQREDEAQREATSAVCPAGASVDLNAPVAGRPLAADAVYAAKTADGRVVAYIASGEASGYSSVVRVMVGVRAEDLSIIRIVVLSQAETPGLGANVAEQKSNFTLWEKLFGPSKAGKTEQLINPFLDQFSGKKPEQFGQVQAITAATITSNATKAAARQAIERIRNTVGKSP